MLPEQLIIPFPCDVMNSVWPRYAPHDRLGLLVAATAQGFQDANLLLGGSNTSKGR